jgi:hypothetical protein
VERRRTGGMTAIAVLNIVFGGVGILNGLYLILGFLAFMYEGLRLGIFNFPVARWAFSLLALATGIVGLVAGIGILMLRPWARALSLVYGGLLIVSCVGSFVVVPIIATIGTGLYDIRSIDAYGLARLIIFSVIYIVIPVPYSPIIFLVFHKPAWKATFAKGGAMRD